MTKRSESAILAHVQEVVGAFGCIATDLGSPAVAVKGDSRETGPSVFITFPADVTDDVVWQVSTTIANQVPEICRVLRNIV